MKSLRQRIEEIDNSINCGEAWSQRIHELLRQALEATSDEEWQPLTDDIKLTAHHVIWRSKPNAPHGGYPVLVDQMAARYVDGRDGPIYTHYRVVRGPEGT